MEFSRPIKEKIDRAGAWLSQRAVTPFFGPKIGQKNKWLHADGVSSWNDAAASRYRELSDTFWPITNENRLWTYNNSC